LADRDLYRHFLLEETGGLSIHASGIFAIEDAARYPVGWESIVAR
jgi:hypothetical protein